MKVSRQDIERTLKRTLKYAAEQIELDHSDWNRKTQKFDYERGKSYEELIIPELKIVSVESGRSTITPPADAARKRIESLMPKSVTYSKKRFDDLFVEWDRSKQKFVSRRNYERILGKELDDLTKAILS
jgi:hypothetical protein